MQERLEVGSHVFIIESNRTITEVVVAARRGEFYTVRFLNGGAIQLRRNRIFPTREETEIKIPVRVEVNRRFRSPYDYGMWIGGWNHEGRNSRGLSMLQK